ncbi:MAG: metalloregulator ArsR/SmtB family transcription factor [Saprospiraceae bacterium]
MKRTKVTFNNEKIQISSEILRALAHPLRIKILEFIDQHKVINVNKIYNTLNLEQSITSQHLRIMRGAGVVITERDGKYVHYSIDYAKVANAMKAVNHYYNAKANA